MSAGFVGIFVFIYLQGLFVTDSSKHSDFTKSFGGILVIWFILMAFLTVDN
jgi:K+ transporter